MEAIMADEATTTAAAAETGDTAEATATADGTIETNTPAEGEAALGDAGKKALDAMKAKWKEAEAKAKAEAEARATLEAKIAGKEAEHQAAQEAQRLKDEALAAANERIKKAEVRAAAASKLTDPQDALRFLDLSEFEVDSDGAVDSAQIAKAIDDLIASKPYLAAQGGRFKGSADGGARNDTAAVSQLTEADMARMSPEERVEAMEKGQFDRVLGRT
jgi:hypothetical protein